MTIITGVKKDGLKIKDRGNNLGEMLIETIIITIVNTIFWTALHFGVAWFVTATIPKEFYNPDNFLFKERVFEKRLYKSIMINIWKDKLPQYNSNFNKRQLPKTITPNFIEQFIMETCKAELIHIAIGLSTFSSIIFVYLNIESLFVSVIVAIIVFIAQIPFILIQRYNRPRLIKLLKSMKKL